MRGRGLSLGLLAAVFLLLSCGPGYYIRKAERNIEKAEKLGATWHRDTAWVAIEIPVPVVRIDTTVITNPGDTVVLERERLRVQIIRKIDTLRVEAECRADTIEVEVPVYITNEITAPEKPFPWMWLFIAVTALALTGAIWKLK